MLISLQLFNFSHQIEYQAHVALDYPHRPYRWWMNILKVANRLLKCGVNDDRNLPKDSCHSKLKNGGFRFNKSLHFSHLQTRSKLITSNQDIMPETWAFAPTEVSHRSIFQAEGIRSTACFCVSTETGSRARSSVIRTCKPFQTGPCYIIQQDNATRHTALVSSEDEVMGFISAPIWDYRDIVG